MNDDLEQRILRQPPRKIPPAWRMDILTAARPESPKAVASIFPVPFSKPDRLAWTALAAVWVIILALNLANRELSPRAIFKSVPMTPELVIAMLACARIGAVHSVIFGGFSSEAIADRNQDARAVAVITADGGWRRGKLLPLKPAVDAAVAKAPSVKHVIVVRRTGNDITFHEGRDHWWKDLVERQSADCPAVPVPADYVIGPGDEVIVRSTGVLDFELRPVVDRDGQIVLPKVGAVQLSGVRVGELEKVLTQQLEKMRSDTDLRLNDLEGRNGGAQAGSGASNAPSADNAALIVPTPSPATVSTAGQSLFGDLETLTAPRTETRPTELGWSRRTSGASSMTSSRSERSISLTRALSRVVFPLPVPPEITMVFRRAMAARRNPMKSPASS
jgi:hypothetical protein